MTFSLQSGMRGAYGKPYGVCARVEIGQILMSCRCKDAQAAIAIEALRRAKFKFPGRQKVLRSNKWGFTKWDRAEYAERRANGTLKTDGVMAQYVRSHGPLGI
jgi:large subunit ribosomal protein L10e